ncbi:MAG: SAM-dependent methyltransferase [Lachnospiraceae bacterium]|nr:SAM-dependent methyltransferase [Lachnospiraceae bacterium]
MENNTQWEKLREKLGQYINVDLKEMIISNARKKDRITKIKVRPVLLKQDVAYQVSSFKGKQVFHENMAPEALCENCIKWLRNDFGQMEVHHQQGALICLSNKKGTLTVKEKKSPAVTNSKTKDCNVTENDVQVTEKKEVRIPAEERLQELSHNRKKKYILEENTPVGFLLDLGVQTPQGKIIHSAYDKFRQINRFLEFVEDVLPALEDREVIRVLDFGCGKSYLTFAIYHYLHEIKKREVQIIGLDLKEDVIAHCNALKDKYGYTDLHFLTGDIKDYTGQDEVDMVVTLHACDTATDYALHKALKWNAKVILSVPCCHHEANRQIKNETLRPMLNYGIVKDRMAALATDALRALLLEKQGYETQLLEFIDMTHTPKNILIRAVKRSKMISAAKQKELAKQETEFTELLGIHTTLQKLLEE